MSLVGLLALAGCGSSGEADGAVPETVECVVTYRPDADSAVHEERQTVQVERTLGADGLTASATFGEGTSEELTFEVAYRSSVTDAQVVALVTDADEEDVRRFITEFGERVNTHIDPYGDDGFTGVEETAHRGAVVQHYCRGVR